MIIEQTETKDISQTHAQLRLFGIIFAIAIGLLAFLYFIFLRLNYSNLYTDLGIEEASAIAENLEDQEIPFRLENGGRDILVQKTKINRVRLNVVESDVVNKRVPGFELFDENQMGLTDFGNQVKYKRAMQGELTRTILLIDGVENARVHLAIPEKRLFKEETDKLSASVTLIAKPGFFDDQDKIRGIQHLVASSIPGLELENVVILSASGEIISKNIDKSDTLTARYVALAQEYEDVFTFTLLNELPDMNASVDVSVLPIRKQTFSGSDSAEPKAKLDHRLKINIVTDQNLTDADKETVRLAIQLYFGFNIESYVVTTFNVRGFSGSLISQNVSNSEAFPASSDKAGLLIARGSLLNIKPVTVVAIIIGGLLFLLTIYISRIILRPQLSRAEHAAIANDLRDGVEHAA